MTEATEPAAPEWTETQQQLVNGLMGAIATNDAEAFDMILDGLDEPDKTEMVETFERSRAFLDSWHDRRKSIGK